MSWHNRQFDPLWVRCFNTKCGAEFVAAAVYRKRKCPKCGMDGKGHIGKKGGADGSLAKLKRPELLAMLLEIRKIVTK